VIAVSAGRPYSMAMLIIHHLRGRATHIRLIAISKTGELRITKQPASWHFGDMISRMTRTPEGVPEILTSPEALRMTRCMSRVYLRLLAATPESGDGEPDLHLSTERHGGLEVSAWEQLRRLARVPERSLGGALLWMHRRRIITYESEDNESEIRIIFHGGGE
jgi:hypothetical protein